MCHHVLPVVLIALVAGLVFGQTPPATKPVPTLCLLLDTFRILEAPAERVGEVYRVRRGRDVEDIPATKVLFAGESRADVQRFLAARASKTPTPTRLTDGGPNAAAFPLFAAKVQPILTNFCARCHSDAASGGAFVLERVPLGYADVETPRRNARVAARFVTRDDPAASPLLTKAVAAHGDLREPAMARTSSVFRQLELWAHWSVAADGSPAPVPGAAKPKATDPFDPDVFNRLPAAK